MICRLPVHNFDNDFNRLEAFLKDVILASIVPYLNFKFL